MELTKEVLTEIQDEAAKHAAIAVNEDWQRAYGRLADAAHHLLLWRNEHARTIAAMQPKAPA